MGNLCCCFKKSYDDDDDSSETRRILDDPSINNDGGSINAHLVTSVTTPNAVPVNYGSTGHGNGQLRQPSSFETTQSQLYQNVLDRLTSRVIDIASIEKACEQADLTDREQALLDKLSTVRKSVSLNPNVQVERMDYPQKTLYPIPLEHYTLMTDVSRQAHQAVQYGFQIHSNEPFVVNFDH